MTSSPANERAELSQFPIEQSGFVPSMPSLFRSYALRASGGGMREEGWRLVGGREEVIGLIHQGAPAVNYSLCTAGVSRTLPCA